MPFGFESPIAGIAGFAAVKLVGYTAVARQMKRAEPEARRHFLTVGLCRTVLGLIFGAAYGLGVGGGLVAVERVIGDLVPVLFYAGLFPVRLLEWDIIMRLFFRGLRTPGPVAWRWRLAGTGWSYALDIPAMLGLFATGRMWIC